MEWVGGTLALIALDRFVSNALDSMGWWDSCIWFWMGWVLYQLTGSDSCISWMGLGAWWLDRKRGEKKKID